MFYESSNGAIDVDSYKEKNVKQFVTSLDDIFSGIGKMLDHLMDEYGKNINSDSVYEAFNSAKLAMETIILEVDSMPDDAKIKDINGKLADSIYNTYSEVAMKLHYIMGYVDAVKDIFIKK